MIIKPLFVEVLVNLHFDRVSTCCDRGQVPFNVIDFLPVDQMTNLDEEDKRDEEGQASKKGE